MISSTLFLATGATLLLVARLSGPVGLGLIVFIGLVLVTIGCALHLAVLIGRLPFRATARFVLVAACWLVLALGTAWVVQRAPEQDLVVALMTVPPLVGLAAVWVPGPDRWAAIAFLALSLALAVLMAVILLEPEGAGAA